MTTEEPYALYQPVTQCETCGHISDVSCGAVVRLRAVWVWRRVDGLLLDLGFDQSPASPQGARRYVAVAEEDMNLITPKPGKIEFLHEEGGLTRTLGFSSVLG